MYCGCGVIVVDYIKCFFVGGGDDCFGDVFGVGCISWEFEYFYWFVLEDGFGVG